MSNNQPPSLREDAKDLARNTMAGFFRFVKVVALLVVLGVGGYLIGGSDGVMVGVAIIFPAIVVIWVVYALVKIKRRDGSITDNSKAKFEWNS